MIKKLILITLVFLFPVLVFSQNIIQGLIVDVNNEPLIGVNVVVKGETIGTISDIDGRYSIETEHGKTLLFSYIGFETIEIEVTSNIINVILKENITTLDEVVAIGYGTIKNSRITGALSRVDSDQIDKRPVARLDQAIQGKIPGVYVQETSGSPGRSLNVRVRGIGSINYGTAPLYVVDGYPISGDLNSITPSDIASIEVLKDAASAAIYGSRGSNGVVLITTKRGGKGKAVVDLNVSYGIQNRFSKVDVLNRDEYIEYAIEERTNSYIYNGGDLSVPEDKRQNYQYAIDPVWRSNPTSLPDHDWQDLISRPAPLQNYSLSVTGGNDNSKYFISANYFDQEGILIESNYKRLSFRANGEISTNKYLTVGLNLSTNITERNDPETDTNQGPVSRSIVMHLLLV